jgi:hypothetical protein
MLFRIENRMAFRSKQPRKANENLMPCTTGYWKRGFE